MLISFLSVASWLIIRLTGFQIAGLIYQNLNTCKYNIINFYVLTPSIWNAAVVVLNWIYYHDFYLSVLVCLWKQLIQNLLVWLLYCDHDRPCFPTIVIIISKQIVFRIKLQCELNYWLIQLWLFCPHTV